MSTTPKDERIARLSKRIDDMRKLEITNRAEAAMMRKIAKDLLAKATGIDETADYQAKEATRFQKMLDEE